MPKECKDCRLQELAKNRLRFEMLQTAQQIEEWAEIAATPDWRESGAELMRRKAGQLRTFAEECDQ